jgi:hypothetical protein
LKKEREGRSWRKAEGKSKRESELEGIKEREESEYRSGFGSLFLSFFSSPEVLTRRGASDTGFDIGRKCTIL